MQNETLSRHQPVSTNSVPKSCPVKEWVKCHVSGPRVDGQGLGGVEGKSKGSGEQRLKDRDKKTLPLGVGKGSPFWTA